MGSATIRRAMSYQAFVRRARDRKLRRRHSVAAVALGGLVLLALGQVPAATAAVTGGPSCAVRNGPPPGANMSMMADEHLAYESWIDSPAGQEADQAVWTELYASYGALDQTGKAGGITERLSRGLIGTALDHAGKAIVVVVDPGRTSIAGLQGRLNAAVHSPGNAGPPPAVRVQAGCFDAAQLLDAATVLAARNWHADAARAAYSYYLDPATSTYQVTVDSRYPDAAAMLAKTLGGRVSVATGTVGRADRFNDGRPHYGGSAIGLASNHVNVCTSGFVVRHTSDGLRGATTAGHCFNNGVLISSGSQAYGATSGKIDFPVYDMMNVLSAVETFQNIIHVDPCCPTTRTQSGAADPVVGTTSVCISGMTSLARCGITISSLDAVLCDQYGCTPGLIAGSRADHLLVSQPGDSGAPVYTRPGSTTALARGMNIGYANGGQTLLAERISNVQNHLGVTVATS